MPLYPADYLGDTEHLSAAESGAYLHLLMHYWQRAGLPDDDARLARIAKMDPQEWQRARPIVAEFFTFPGWKHGRVEEELAKAADISSKRRSAAVQRHSKSDANEMQLDTPLPLPSPSQEKQPDPESPSLRDSAGERAKIRRRPQIALPKDWKPGTESLAYAKTVGLSEAETGRELQRLSNHARQSDRRCADWDAAFQNWCLKAAEERGRPPPEVAGAHAVKLVFVRMDTEPWNAWQAHLKATGGKGSPCVNFGWHFPTEWPPGREPKKEQVA